MAETGFDPAVEQGGKADGLTAGGTVGLVRELCSQLENTEGFHGNIWPGSVLTDEEGKVSLAGASDDPVSERSIDQVEYLAPEYFWDNSGSPASDVYSLGMMLYSGCNNGYLPFQPKGGALTEKDRSGALRKRMKGEPIPIPAGMSREMGDVVRKALAYEPTDRYQTPAELLEALNGTEEARAAEAEVSAAAAGAAAAMGGLASVREAPETEPIAAADEAVETQEDLSWLYEGEEAPADAAQTEPLTEADPAEKRYTVQKDFEPAPKTNKKKNAPAAETATKKKRISPVVPVVAVLAAAAIGGGTYYAVNQNSDRQISQIFSGPEETQEEVSEPFVILTSESPEPTMAPIPLIVESEESPKADEDKAKEEADKEKEKEKEQEAKEEEEPVVTGSPTVDGKDVEPVSDTMYVSGVDVNLRTGPGTSYEAEKTLTRGTKLQRTGTVDGWSQVQYEGKEYYISTNLIQEEDPFAGTAQSLDNTTDGSSATKPTSVTNNGAAGNSGAAAGNSGTGTATAASGTGRVTAGANVRSGPGTNYAVIGSAGAGSTYSIQGSQDGWYKINYNGQTGYIYGGLMSTSGSAPANSGNTGGGTSGGTSSSSGLVTVNDTVTVTGSSVNLRTGAGTNYRVAATVPRGTQLQRTGTVGGWSRVNYQGQTLYISSSYVSGGGSTSGTGRVTTAANVRSGPGTNYSIIGGANAGDTFTVLDSSNGWNRINYNGQNGYIAGNLMTVSGSSASTGAVGTGRVNYDANIRSGPGTNYSIIGSAYAGNVINITGSTDNWYQVNVNGQTGYIARSLMTMNTTASSASGTARVNYDSNIRSGPGTEYTIVGSAYAGSTVTITGSTDNWYQISANGVSGYIAKNLVTAGASGSSSTGTVGTGRVNYDANIRSGPGTNYSIIGSAYAGNTVNITGSTDNWYQINVNGSTGYIAKSLVTYGGSSSGSSATINGSTGRVNYDSNIRSGPGTNYSVIGSAYAGNTVNITGSTDNWYQINVNGRTGYIAKSLVTLGGSSSSSGSGYTVNADSGTGWVNSDANIRSGPGTSYSIVGDVRAGAAVTITGATNYWYRVSVNGVNGFIAKSLVNR